MSSFRFYDSMSQFVVPALRLTGKTGAVKVGTFNGTPFVLDYIQQGLVDMDIGESLDWIAYATIDGHVRDLCGLKSPAALNVPFYIFDKSNAKTPASRPATIRAMAMPTSPASTSCGSFDKAVGCRPARH